MPVFLKFLIIGQKDNKHGVTLFFTENGDDNQQVAGKAEHGGNDNSAGREDVGVEGLLRAARPRHQQVACGNEDTGSNEDAATGQEDFNQIVHIGECIVGRCLFYHIVQLRRVPAP